MDYSKLSDEEIEKEFEKANAILERLRNIKTFHIDAEKQRSQLEKITDRMGLLVKKLDQERARRAIIDAEELFKRLEKETKIDTE